MHNLFEQSSIEIRTFNDFINEEKRRLRGWSSHIAMYRGDMWDKGRGYIGPLPVKDDDNAALILRNIRRMFTSRNVIAEVVDRAVDGLLSKSPNWQIYSTKNIQNNPRLKRRQRLIPTVVFDGEGKRVSAEAPKPDKKVEEAELILSELWTNAKLADVLKESVTSMMINGKGKLRIYFSKKKIGFTKDMIEATKYIKVQYIDTERATVLEDGSDKLSVIEITSKKDKTWEISFTDDNGKTFIGSITSGGSINLQDNEEETDDPDSEIVKDAVALLMENENVDLSTELSLGGNITVDEILGKPLLSESMLQNNRALNLDLSLAVGILVESGYAELITTNVAMRTKTVTDPHSGEEIEVPIGIERGPTTLTNLVGEQTMNPQTGQVQFEEPTVHWKEPSPVDSFVKGEDLFYRQILSEAKQLFVLITSDATASGESRVQSRQDFLKKIQRYKAAVDVHGGWLLNTLLKLTASLSGKDGYFSDYNVIFDCNVSAGELTADEKNTVISQYTAELISRETAMVLLGTEDPLIEIDKIRIDQAEKLDNQVKRLEATAKFGSMGDNGRPKQLPDGSTKDKTKK